MFEGHSVELEVAGEAEHLLDQFTQIVPHPSVPENGVRQNRQRLDPFERGTIGIVIKRGPHQMFLRSPAGNDRRVASGGIAENGIEFFLIAGARLQEERMPLADFPPESINKQK